MPEHIFRFCVETRSDDFERGKRNIGRLRRAIIDKATEYNFEKLIYIPAGEYSVDDATHYREGTYLRAIPYTAGHAKLPPLRLYEAIKNKDKKRDRGIPD